MITVGWLSYRWFSSFLLFFIHTHTHAQSVLIVPGPLRHRLVRKRIIGTVKGLCVRSLGPRYDRAGARYIDFIRPGAHRHNPSTFGPEWIYFIESTPRRSVETVLGGAKVQFFPMTPDGTTVGDDGWRLSFPAVNIVRSHNRGTVQLDHNYPT